MAIRLLHALLSVIAGGSVGLAMTGNTDAQAQQPVQPNVLLLDAAAQKKVQELRRGVGIDVLEGTIFQEFDKPVARQPVANERIEQLRTIAEQLDSAAGRLERLELYPTADGLRAQADRVRQTARRLASTSRSTAKKTAEPFRRTTRRQRRRPGR
jgi:hypothetical protein